VSKRSRVLVTGGSGFIGANLTRALIAAGHDVHLLLRQRGDRWRLVEVENQYTAHEADLLDMRGLRRVVDVVHPDVVYHLAAFGVAPEQQDRQRIRSTIIAGTANLLAALSRLDYRAFIHAGTGAEYGCREGPINEDDPLAPDTDYGAAKAAASMRCLAEWSQGRPVITVRVFSAYGPWERRGRLVPYVMGCCLRGEAPRVSCGCQVRDFIHADDVVTLLQRAADCAGTSPGILHAATGIGHSVREVVDAILTQAAAGMTPLFGAEPLRPTEPRRYLARIERTVTATGWQPRYDLRCGLAKTWAWCRAWAGSARTA